MVCGAPVKRTSSSGNILPSVVEDRILAYLLILVHIDPHYAPLSMRHARNRNESAFTIDEWLGILRV